MGIRSNRKRVSTDTNEKKNKPVKIKLPIKAKKKDDDAPIILKGKKAKLLEEACKLSKEKKKAEARIKKIKTLLDIKVKGTYKTKDGAKVVISESTKWSEIEPEKLYKKFIKNKKKKRFWEVVKVQLTPLAKIVPQSAIDKMRFKLDPVKKWSFK